MAFDEAEEQQHYGWRCSCHDGGREHPYYGTPYHKEDAQYYAWAHKGKNVEHVVEVYAIADRR